MSRLPDAAGAVKGFPCHKAEICVYPPVNREMEVARGGASVATRIDAAPVVAVAQVKKAALGGSASHSSPGRGPFGCTPRFTTRPKR